MKNKNLVLRVASAVAGVLGVIFGFLVNFDFKVVEPDDSYFVREIFDTKTWSLLKKPDERTIELFEYSADGTYKSAFKVIAAIALFVCLAAVLVLVASLVVDLLNKKCEVLDKVANIAKYVLAVGVVVLTAGVLLYLFGNSAEVETDVIVKLAITNLALFIVSFVMLVGSTVCAFLANKETK